MEKGYLTFYGNAATEDKVALCKELCAMAGGDLILCASEVFYENVDDIDADYHTVAIGSHISVAEFLGLIGDRKGGVGFEIYGGSLGKRIQDAVERRIPAVVRGMFKIGAVYVEVGRHPLIDIYPYPYDCGDGDRLIATPGVSLSINGYNTPDDMVTYRREVLRLPEVEQLKASLRPIIPDVETAIYWG